jgi:xylulose-5-phosphate/fructose-6-phosphate phosphoketolase
MSIVQTVPATDKELALMNAYWRAANYLSACQLYLLDNPLLKEPLCEEHIKKKIVGHWGTVPGQNFIYTHLNRVIKNFDLDMIYISGPGHGGNAMVAQDWLDGSYQEVNPNISGTGRGCRSSLKQFSFPAEFLPCGRLKRRALSTRAASWGYSLSHAFGAVTDNPG